MERGRNEEPQAVLGEDTSAQQELGKRGARQTVGETPSKKRKTTDTLRRMSLITAFFPVSDPGTDFAGTQPEIRPSRRLPPQGTAKAHASTSCPVPQSFLPRPHPIAKTAILSSQYTVMKDGYKEEQFDIHRQWLTITPKDASAYGGKKEDPIEFFAEDSTTFVVPRYYGLARWGMVPEANDKRNSGIRIAVPFVGNLSPKQLEVCNQVLQQFFDPSKTPGGILMCPCGFGKTVCAIYIACTLGVKTLFTVRMDEHMENFLDGFRIFAPGARAGIVKQNKLQVKEMDFVVASEPTILSREYGEDVFEDFGLWITDECHHGATPSFEVLKRKIAAKYLLGLSATPRSKKGLTQVLFWNFGPVLAQVHKNHDTVLVHMVKYTKGNQIELKYKSGALRVPDMITRLTEDPVRNYDIVQRTAGYVLRPEPLPIPRKVMILTDRLHQLGVIPKSERKTISQQRAEAIEKRGLYHLLMCHFEGIYSDQRGFRVDTSIENRTRIFVERDGAEWEAFSIGYVIGGLKKETRDNGKKCRVILATLKEAEENLNVPDVDTVMIVCPRSDVEQASGRGLRTFPGKNVPLIVYYVDPFSMFEKQGFKVHNYFKREGYEITWEQV